MANSSLHVLHEEEPKKLDSENTPLHKSMRILSNPGRTLQRLEKKALWAQKQTMIPLLRPVLKVYQHISEHPLLMSLLMFKMEYEMISWLW